MGKKREQMTDEEYKERLEKLAELRKIALAKRQEMAKPKKDLNEKLKRQTEIVEQKKQLLESKMKEAEELEAKIKDPLPDFTPPPLNSAQAKAHPPCGAKAFEPGYDFTIPWEPTPHRGALEAVMFYEKMRSELKDKYKSKYRSKYQPAPPVEPVVNPIQETAKDSLKNKIDDEVKKMAMMSLFGKAF